MELFLNSLIHFIHIKIVLIFLLFTIVISYSKITDEYLSEDVLLHSLLPRAYCEPVENS